MNPPSSQVEFSLDPIIYFYTHSLAIILASAVVFMTLGVWIGWLTWARYRRRARAYQEECDLLRHEIAALKRRIGDETVSAAPLVLINEDAPVPEPLEVEPILPGFDTPFMGLKIPGVEPEPGTAPVPVETAVPKAPVEWKPSETAPVPKEGLAAAVLGHNGTTHHTLEPVAPPDSITELPPPVVQESPPAVTLPAPSPAVVPPEPQAVPPPEPSAPKAVPAAQIPDIADPIHSRHSEAPNGTQAPVVKPVKVKVAAVEPAKPKGQDATAAFADELASGVAVNDPKLGILLRFQPERWDDLTLLRGVGEGLQQALHDHGVHTFKQIAYWTESNVEEFSFKIEAKDRIRRDQWVTQARDMHFLKYGEKLA